MRRALWSPILLPALLALTRRRASRSRAEDACFICQTPFQILLDEEEHFLALDSPGTWRSSRRLKPPSTNADISFPCAPGLPAAIATESLGVVRISRSCEHLFCRRDASRWLSKVRRVIFERRVVQR